MGVEGGGRSVRGDDLSERLDELREPGGIDRSVFDEGQRFARSGDRVQQWLARLAKLPRQSHSLGVRVALGRRGRQQRFQLGQPLLHLPLVIGEVFHIQHHTGSGAG